MYKERRNKLFNRLGDQSITILFSGKAPQKTSDQNYYFTVNRNFFYLTGINQEESVLLLIKGNNTTSSFLFIAKTDPVKALWDGSGISFEDASEITDIPIENIREINTLKGFISQLLTTSRRALYGPIDTFYLDLERQNEEAAKNPAEYFARYLLDLYPFVQIKTCQMELAELRMIKDETEVKDMQKAIAITKLALDNVMSTLKPGMFEYQVEAEFNYVLNYHNAINSFNTIAAQGKNATILHYIDNDSKLEDNNLILLDLGVYYQNYASDISRTYPINGKFTRRQKEVYQVVLDANKAAISQLKAGMTIKQFNDIGRQVLIDGAKKLGLIKEDHEINRYYYHSLGHYLGLDVHDVGNYSLPIPEGAVITVEPGLYIAEENIGIRIEDNCYVTKDGCINLSKAIVKEIDEIEAFMKK